MFLPGLADPEIALRRASEVAAAVAAPIATSVGPVTMGVSVGVLVVASWGGVPSAGTLLRHADQAMYHAKRDGSGVHLFDPAEREPRVRRPPLPASRRRRVHMSSTRWRGQRGRAATGRRGSMRASGGRRSVRAGAGRRPLASPPDRLLAVLADEQPALREPPGRERREVDASSPPRRGSARAIPRPTAGAVLKPVPLWPQSR